MPRAGSEHELTRPSLWRFRIGHLFLLTLGVALGLWVWRLRGKPFIGFNLRRAGWDPSSGLIDVPVALGFGDLGNLLVPFVFWAILGLLKGMMPWARGSDSNTASAQAVVPHRLAWLGRLALVVCFAFYLVLFIELNTKQFVLEGTRGIYEIREQWLAQSAAMLLVGMMLVHSATSPTSRASADNRLLAGLGIRKRRQPGWVKPLGLFLWGCLVLLVMTEEMIIPHLGFIAVYGISLTRPPSDLPMERIDATYGERFAAALSPLLVALVLALAWLAWTMHVTRRCRRASRAPTSSEWGIHVIGTLLVLSAAANLVVGTVPYLSRFLSEALASLIDPVNAAVVCVGFAGMSAGLAAQIALRPPKAAAGSGFECRQQVLPRSRSIQVWWLARLAVGLAIAAVFGVCVYLEQSDSATTFDWPVLGVLAKLPLFFAALARTVLIWQQPLVWAVALLALALKSFFARYQMHAAAAERTPSGAPCRLAPEGLHLFWMWWLMTALLMLAAVPVLGLAGFLSWHATLRLGW